MSFYTNLHFVKVEVRALLFFYHVILSCIVICFMHVLAIKINNNNNNNNNNTHTV